MCHGKSHCDCGCGHAMPPLPMGDMMITDRNDLGVDFDIPSQPEDHMFVNDLGADELARWLVDRAIMRKQQEMRSQLPPAPPLPTPVLPTPVVEGAVLREAVAAIRREAGFGERDFTPVGQTKGLADRSLQSYYDETDRESDAMADVPTDSNPDHELPAADGNPHPRKNLEAGKKRPRKAGKKRPRKAGNETGPFRRAIAEGFGEDTRPMTVDLNVLFMPSPLTVERHAKHTPVLRDDPLATIGRSDYGLKGDLVATDLPGSMKAKIEVTDEDTWDDGDYTDDLDLDHFDFADPATDSPFR